MMGPKTRFTKLDEYYPAVTALIEWLKRDGHLDDSRSLDTAFHKGSLGSEVLGDTMLALKALRGRYSPELKDEINQCYEFAKNYRKILKLS